MRKLLDSLSGLIKRDGNPLADAKAATNWMKDVRQGDVWAQLLAVREMVTTIAKIDQPTLGNLLALLAIDEQSQPALDMLCQQYIQNPRMSKQIEERLWGEIMTHVRTMLMAYHRFVRMEQYPPNEEAGFLRSAAMILGRSLRFICLQVKWHYFRYEIPPANLWAGANQLYRLSEVGSVDVDAIKLYPDSEAAPSSCADEYLRIQMLATLNNGNFSARQFDWADRWLGLWCGHIQVERKYRDNVHQFCVNLAEPAGPTKIHHQVTGDMLRFWGVVDLLAEMSRLMALLEAGESPSRLGLGDDARMPSCLDFMRQLEILWSRERSQQSNRSERLKVNKTLEVAHGLSNLFAAVRQDDEKVMARASSRGAPDNDEITDMKLYGYVTERTKQKLVSMQKTNHAYIAKVKAVEHDTWVVENQSEGGFGAVLPIEGHEWVRLGVLLAVRGDKSASWLVAVVRRLNRMNNEQLYAGVQILTSTPISINMKSLAPAPQRSAEISIEGVDTVGLILPKFGLYIPYQTKERRSNTMLVHTADYQTGQLIEVSAREKVFAIRFGEILEKGPDWIWAVVEVVK